MWGYNAGVKTIRLERHLDSETLHLPELRDMVGKDVVIIVQEREGVNHSRSKQGAAGDADYYPLRGSVLRYDDPFEPAVPPEDWDVYH